MKRYIYNAIILSFLVTITQLFSLPTVYGAPGDFIFQWGAQFNIDNLQDVAVDSNGDVYVVAQSMVHVFDSTGKLLRKWGVHGTGNGQFMGPEGIAIDERDNVYVADTGNSRVQVFDSAGNFLRKWGSFGAGDGQFHDVTGIAVDMYGNVYVTDTGFDMETVNVYDRVQIFDSAGNFLKKWGVRGSGDGQFNHLSGIEVDRCGNLYVADRFNNRIQAFDTAGNFLRKWGSKGTGDGQLSAPAGISVDKNCNVYVTDGDTDNLTLFRVQVFDSAGTFLRKWGSSGDGDGQFYGPNGIVVDGNGNAYVADSGNDRVQVFNSLGNFLRKWGSHSDIDGQFWMPNGVAVDGSGRTYVADTGNARVQVFDNSGNFLRKWGSYGTGNGQFSYPKGIAVDGSDNVYVTESGNCKVQIFDSAGNFIRKFGSCGTGDGQFSDLDGIAVDGRGNVYVVESINARVQVFDSSGTFLRKWGSYGTGDGQFRTPYEIAVDGNGNVYVTDYDRRVQVFDTSGNFLRKWGGNLIFGWPAGIAADGSGNVYVVDAGSNYVYFFDNSGAALGLWSSFPSDSADIELWGVTSNKTGSRVYVTDIGSNRILAFVGFGNQRLPTPWVTQNIGTVGVAVGTAGYLNGTFSLSGTGADIWGTSDGFRYVYQSLTGDGQIIARLDSMQSRNSWAKVGVMIRKALAANSRNALMAITPGNGANFQRRLTSGGSSVNTAGAVVTAPYWVKLVRSGNTFSGYISTNGVNWVLVGSDTITMAGTVYVGLALTNHGNTTLCTATLDGVSVKAGPPVTPPTVNITVPTNGTSFSAPASIAITATATAGTGATVSRVDFYAGTTLVGSDTASPYSFNWSSVPVGSYSLTARVTDSLNRTATSSPVGITVAASGLPTPWATRDIGSVGIGGSASYLNGTFSLNGSGSDIWGKADSFRYVYHALTGNGQITARVASLQNTNIWAKGGVMIRETLAANSRQALMALTPGNGAAFQRRLTTGGFSVSTAGPRVTAPYWVRLVRSGNTFSGYISTNGVNWVLAGSDTITMASTVYVGLAVTSHNNAALCKVTMDGMQ